MDIYSHLFHDNKYTKWYFSIVNSRSALGRSKKDSSYYENHHIIPRCLGGDNSSKNLVLLTAKEHFLLHWILTKMCIELAHTHKMVLALRRMICTTKTQQRITASWMYSVTRNKPFKHAESTKQKMRKPKSDKSNYRGMIGKHKEETKQKMRKPRSTTENMKIPKSQDFIEQQKKRKWWNNGIKNVFCEICPEGFVKGIISKPRAKIEVSKETRHLLSLASKDRKWYNNGTEEKLVRVKPKGWQEGRIKHKMNKKRSKLTKKMIDDIVEERKKGTTIDKILKRFSIGAATFYDALKQHQEYHINTDW